MTMPKVVPVLKAEDFIMGPMSGPNHTFCLIGWREKIFPDEWGTAMDLHQLCRAAGKPHICCGSTKNNPSNRRSAARIWTKFIAKLGYTEDGPEMTLEWPTSSASSADS